MGFVCFFLRLPSWGKALYIEILCEQNHGSRGFDVACVRRLGIETACFHVVLGEDGGEPPIDGAQCVVIGRMQDKKLRPCRTGGAAYPSKGLARLHLGRDALPPRLQVLQRLDCCGMERRRR